LRWCERCSNRFARISRPQQQSGTPPTT